MLLQEEEEREREMWASALEDLAERLDGDQGEGPSSTASTIAKAVGLPQDLPRRKAVNVKEVLRAYAEEQAAGNGSGSSSSSAPAEDEASQSSLSTTADARSGGKRKQSSAPLQKKKAKKSSGGDKGHVGADEEMDTTEGLDADADGGTVTSTSTEPLLARLLPALPAHQLQSPLVPDRKETEAFILRERKRMLREEYVGR